jgi:tRNA(Ile)-lysidine synthase
VGAERSPGERISGLVASAFESGLLPRQRLFVAISGGQDSLALLHAIASTAPSGLQIHALHVDHGMRSSSRTDARVVAQFARSLGVPAVVRRYDVAGWVRRSGLNAESAARSVRYRLLAQMAASLGGGPIVTGHTGDDVVETVLLHFLRGTGLDGLGGLLPVQSLPISALEPAPPRLGALDGELTIVRPLLDIERWETAAYCDRQGLKWVIDESNADVALTRNRVRHHLVPLLETYNPSIRASVRRLASLARDDARVLEALTEAEWRLGARVEPSSVSFDRQTLGGYERSISSRLIRRAAAHLKGQAMLSYEQVERCLSLASLGSGITRLSGGLEWRVTAEEVALVKLR